MAGDALRESLQALSEDAEDYWVPARVPRIERPISALEFLRDYVQPSIPCILKQGCGLLDHWPAIYHWQNWEHLKALVGPETLVSVNATPNGRGDAILDVERSCYPFVMDQVAPTTPERSPPRGTHTPPEAAASLLAIAPPSLVFVKPEVRRMPFGEFVDRLLGEGEGEEGRGDTVLYLSQQDDNLRKEFPMLARPSSTHSNGSDGGGVYLDGSDIDSNGFALAREAFGNEPDAVNLWIGDERSVSSMHRDPYQNMYAVVVGEKHFTLLPPCDAWALPEATNLPQAHFRHFRHSSDLSDDDEGGGEGEEESFEVVLEPDAESISWIDLEMEVEDGGAASYGSSSGSRSSKPSSSPPPLGRRLQHRWRPRHAPHRGRWRWEGQIHPIECTVKAGEVLFLPALWYHRVTQTCPTVAVNFWHDMRFDSRFVYWQFVGRVGKALQQLEAEEEEEEAGGQEEDDVEEA